MPTLDDLQNQDCEAFCFDPVNDSDGADAVRSVASKRAGQGLSDVGILAEPVEGPIDPGKEPPVRPRQSEIALVRVAREFNDGHDRALSGSRRASAQRLLRAPRPPPPAA